MHTKGAMVACEKGRSENVVNSKESKVRAEGKVKTKVWEDGLERNERTGRETKEHGKKSKAHGHGQGEEEINLKDP